MLPAAVRTYAPEGETPVLRYRYWEHLSVISAITPEGKLYTMKQEKAFDSSDIVRFLRHLLRHIDGKLLVIWDGLPAHRSRAVKDFLREGATRRLHLEQLPGYAPELNPAEGVWHYLKNVEMKNLCCHDLQELRDELRRAIERLRHRMGIIQSFTRHALGSAKV